MSSLPTTEQANIDQYYEVIRKFDPELYLIKLALQETGVNAMVIPKVIRAVFNLSTGTGEGKVQVFIKRNVIQTITSEENDQVNEKALIDR